MVAYDENGHHFTCTFEPDGRLAVTVDEKSTARGYLVGNLVRFPKSLAIGDDFVMTLTLPAAVVKQLNA
ncbi:hypothetical protein [Lacticaseibacillus porcinae]|uniref:hypothetical protein n=1 Tax=Lacticaseibacillus porcinae TaxID=1123687 RepID=UPI000F7A77FD|nr:hypothetical protein [Lacticaseibacillus porcinae]